MIALPGSIWGNLADRANNDLWELCGTGTPVDGSSGTAAGLAGPFSTYIDLTNKISYRNTGTKASPIWATGGIQYARTVYDASTDSLLQGAVTPARKATLPNKAIVIGGVIDVITAPTSGGSATIAIGTSAGGSATNIKAATAIATYSALIAVVPLFTAASMFKMTAAGDIIFTIATADLLTGKIAVHLAYLIGE